MPYLLTTDANVQIRTGYPRILLTVDTYSLIIDGSAEQTDKNLAFFIPSGSYCMIPAISSAICINLLSADNREMLKWLDCYYRFSDRKQLQLPSEHSSTVAANILNDMPIAEVQSFIEGTLVKSWRDFAAKRAGNYMYQTLEFALKLEEGLQRSKRLSVTGLAQILAMDEATLWRKCKEMYSSSPKKLIDKWRHTQSTQLLLTTNYTLDAIADEIGYASGNYLSTFIRKKSGHTPRALRAVYGRLYSDR